MRERRQRPASTLLVLVVLLLAVVTSACRPAIADEDTSGDTGGSAAGSGPAASFTGVNASDLPSDTAAASAGPATPEPSLQEIATAVPAQALQPKNQVNVQVRLFHGFDPADAPLQYADTLNHYTAVNLVVDVAPPIAGYDVFSVAPAPDVVVMWVGTVADVAPAATSGRKLESVGEFLGRDTTVLVTPKKGAVKSAAQLKGTVLVDTAGAAASLKAAGLPPAVKVQLPDDPGAPFDPTPLIDGTVKAAAVNAYDGWARIQEAAVAAGISPTDFVATPLRPASSPFLGELIWVQPDDLITPDLKAAVTAFLGAVGQAEVECRDNLDDCAGAVAAQSDRTPDGLAWSIDQVDRLQFPTKDGILHIDQAEWDRTLAALKTVGLDGSGNLSVSNDLVDAVLAALTSLDIHGTNWKPEDRKLIP